MLDLDQVLSVVLDQANMKSFFQRLFVEGEGRIHPSLIYLLPGHLKNFCILWKEIES